MRLGNLLLRQWRSRPGRAIATAASIAVAVGAIVATWVSASVSRSGYNRLAEVIDGYPTVDVLARGGGRFVSDEVPPIADVPGVRAMVPLIYRPTLLRVADNRVREIAVGVDAAGLVSLGLLELEAGEPCRNEDECLLDASLAKSLGLRVGDEVLFFARRRIERMVVTGLVKPGSMNWFAEGGGVIVDIKPLTALARATGMVDRVRVVLQADASRPAVRKAIGERLPDNLMAEIPAGRASLAEDVLHAANLGLDFVTGLTVAMAFFIVGNAMLMNVSERRRGFSLLRLLGATSKQIRRFVSLEAALLGAAGGIVGAALGRAAAGPITEGIARALQHPAAAAKAAPWIVPAAIVTGVCVAVAAAWWPAREAGRVDLLEGVAAAPPPPPPGISWRFVTAVVVLTSFAMTIQALVILGIFPPRMSVPGGIGLMMAFIATTPLLLPPVVRILALLVPRRLKIEGTLAVEQILRQPVRTALTTAVLVVAVSNGIGLGHVIRDNVDDVLGWYGRMMKADWVLSRAGLLQGVSESQPVDSQDKGTEEQIRALPGVAAVEGVGVTTGRAGGSACVIVARDIPEHGPLPLEPIDATEDQVRAALARGEAVAGTVLARRTGIKPGDDIQVEVYGRTVTVKVAALMVDYTSGGSSLLVRRDVGHTLFGMKAPDILLVTAAEGHREALREPLDAIASEEALLLRSFGEVREMVDRIVQGLVGSLWAILGLGFVVGSLGVANTVTMSVLEKRRTLGLLRAVGMTNGQVTRMVVLESVLLAAAGSFIGLAAGMVSALFIQLSSQPLLGHPISVTFRPGVVAANLAAAIAVTTLAAWLPARRAVRMDLLEAISAE
jgi:putative ABC transport system permease protein